MEIKQRSACFKFHFKFVVWHNKDKVAASPYFIAFSFSHTEVRRLNKKQQVTETFMRIEVLCRNLNSTPVFHLIFNLSNISTTGFQKV